ncbi:MAG: hypothetical protein ACLQLH_01845 [Terracidiphilus sp.]
MRSPARSVAWLLPMFLTACIHITGHKPAPALPPPIHSQITLDTTPIELPESELMLPTMPLISDLSMLPEETPKPPIRHRRPASDTPQSALEDTGVSAIGELSSGDLPDEWRETADSIAATESGLKSIHHTLSSGQRKTATQIRRFLEEAKQALDSGDVDGAQTLVAKAKVLLDEIAR